jgi:SPP1 gp7 family putative phage head morphogenesis protein
MAKNLTDEAIRLQVLLERLKSGQVRNFTNVFKEINRIVRRSFANFGGSFSQENKRFLNAFLRELEKAMRGVYSQEMSLYLASLEESAGVFVILEAETLKKVVRGIPTLKLIDTATAYRKALARPMSHSGETVKDFVGQFAGKESKRVVNTIRKGVSQGQTNQELMQVVVGTRSRNYRDSILQQSRRNAEAIIRTTTQHIASSARQEFWESNKDVVKGYEWVSTLDRRTTQVCKSLDGQEFEFGKGPIPPIHIRCRSTTIATVDKKFDFLKEGRTRSAEFGPTNGREDYYDWLKRQPKSVQLEALGPTRMKLFRDGGLSPDEFSKLNLDKNFEPLTLDEMKRLEPEAFKKAGI